MLKNKNIKINKIFSPVNGYIIDLESVNDILFKSKKVGDGIAIKPSDGYIVSPCNGQVEYILPEKHALFISCVDNYNTQILLHIGLDTVEMNGDGFNCLVFQNQKVKVGDPLMVVDLKKIKQYKKDDTIILVIPNNNIKIQNKNSGYCQVSKTILFQYKI